MKSALKTHGGKYYLSQRIIELMPPHKKYLEAYCGGCNVLINKPCEGVAEWANDLNGLITNFWRMIQKCPDDLIRALLGVPFSQVEFLELARKTPVTDEIAAARDFFIKNRMSRQGLGKDYATPTSRTRRGMNEHVSAYWGAIEGFPELHERLRRVEVWNRPAVEAIKKLDCEDFLTYCDPPYMPEVRVTKTEYGVFEMTAEQHEELLVCLAGMRGKFMLSGYDNPLYEAYALAYGWNRVEIKIPNSASSKRTKDVKTECIWMNF